MFGVTLEKAVDFTSPEVLGGYAATALVAVIGLLLTVFILKKVLFKPVQKMLHDRQREVDESLENRLREEEELRAREERIQELERTRAEEEKEKRSRLEEELRLLEEEKTQEAEALAKSRIEEADRLIEAKRKSEEDRVYRQAVDLAVDAMSRLMDRQVTGDEASALSDSINERGRS